MVPDDTAAVDGTYSTDSEDAVVDNTAAADCAYNDVVLLMTDVVVDEASVNVAGFATDCQS